MIEYWDLYNENRELINKIVKRGDKLLDNEYHLVANAWVMNDKNEFIITQRSENKSHPLMWECTGGSALKGETSLDAAIREVKEELGINVYRENSKLIGTTKRHYPNCPDILDVYIFKSNVTINEVTIQKEEVNDVMWATREEILTLLNEGKFEANAFFDEVLNYKKNKIYYVGFKANNAICNENFFDGTITIYPANEKGNIYFADRKIEDTSSTIFIENYKKFVENTIMNLKKKDPNIEIIYFNKKTKKLLNNIANYVNFSESNKDELVEFLNNKKETREFLSDTVPVLKCNWIEQLDYYKIKKEYGFPCVIQGVCGSGGDNTYYINSLDDLKTVPKGNLYCISEYKKHIPINVTIIIGENENIIFPLSIQLIKKENKKFLYKGGDFVAAQDIDENVFAKISEYNEKIIEKIKKLGYRGILGIDYILDNNNDIYFMEINPRFQASSFLINIELKKYNTCLAELHYNAINKRKLYSIKLNKINKSFINCNKVEVFKEFHEDEIIKNGYFAQDNSTFYRKVFYSSILNSDFESL